MKTIKQRNRVEITRFTRLQPYQGGSVSMGEYYLTVTTGERVYPVRHGCENHVFKRVRVSTVRVGGRDYCVYQPDGKYYSLPYVVLAGNDRRGIAAVKKLKG